MRLRVFWPQELSAISRFLLITFFCGALLAILWGFHTMTLPIIGPVQYTVDGQKTLTGKMPLLLKSSGEHLSVVIPLTLSSLTPRSLYVRPDDCLDSLTVNGTVVISDLLPFCDYAHGKMIDLHNYLHPGNNILILEIRDHGGMGGVDIRPPSRHPLLLLLVFGWMGILSWYAWTVLPLLPLSDHARPVVLVITFGVLLRFFYFLSTPYTLRGHDADGHLEYVQYLLTHFALPPPHEGWEFYQPPLYYLFGAFWIGLLHTLGIVASPALLLQGLSFILTTAALAVSGFLALHLFSARSSLILFTSIIATLPSTVFFAARINNDVLFLLLGTASIALLLWWWEHPRTSTWYLFITTVGLGLLTKFNAVLLLPSFLLPYIHHRTVRGNLERSAASCFLLLLIAGWFYLPRMSTEERPHTLVVGNIGNLNSALHVPNTFTSLATFNPFKVLSHPFNNVWNDTERRQYFWEYFFRSALFGEFSYDPALRFLARGIVGLALFLLCIGTYGIWTTLRAKTPWFLPIALLLASSLCGSIAYRILFPYASSQDFRYAILLLFPVTFFIVHGIEDLPHMLRRIAGISTFLFAGLCTAFTITISILP